MVQGRWKAPTHLSKSVYSLPFGTNFLSVLIRGVASFQEGKFYFGGLFKVVRIQWRPPSRLKEVVHCTA